MSVNDSLASIQLFEQRRQARISKPEVTVIGPHMDAVRLQLVECVGHFRRWHRGRFFAQALGMGVGTRSGQRLVEVVGIKGHMDGFTMSRVWDRTQ
jgi:hypothetical protein